MAAIPSRGYSIYRADNPKDMKTLDETLQILGTPEYKESIPEEESDKYFLHETLISLGKAKEIGKLYILRFGKDIKLEEAKASVSTLYEIVQTRITSLESVKTTKSNSLNRAIELSNGKKIASLTKKIKEINCKIAKLKKANKYLKDGLSETDRFVYLTEEFKNTLIKNIPGCKRKLNRKEISSRMVETIGCCSPALYAILMIFKAIMAIGKNLFSTLSLDKKATTIPDSLPQIDREIHPISERDLAAIEGILNF